MGWVYSAAAKTVQKVVTFTYKMLYHLGGGSPWGIFHRGQIPLKLTERPCKLIDLGPGLTHTWQEHGVAACWGEGKGVLSEKGVE